MEPLLSGNVPELKPYLKLVVVGDDLELEVHTHRWSVMVMEKVVDIATDQCGLARVYLTHHQDLVESRDRLWISGKKISYLEMKVSVHLECSRWLEMIVQKVVDIKSDQSGLSLVHLTHHQDFVESRDWLRISGEISKNKKNGQKGLLGM